MTNGAVEACYLLSVCISVSRLCVVFSSHSVHLSFHAVSICLSGCVYTVSRVQDIFTPLIALLTNQISSEKDLMWTDLMWSLKRPIGWRSELGCLCKHNLCVSVPQCVSLCLNVSRCVSMCLNVSHCVTRCLFFCRLCLAVISLCPRRDSSLRRQSYIGSRAWPERGRLSCSSSSCVAMFYDSCYIYVPIANHRCQAPIKKKDDELPKPGAVLVGWNLEYQSDLSHWPLFDSARHVSEINSVSL